ncbi:DUF5333 domain-containing protein [Roseovarius nanhaiticus]|uniref:NADH dehydrogenase subunit E n=1 Tax=Roseovarius nanhaiticus TaxID=573024 RepID=A0A1N7HEL7_9RHOB|nr:DUF5333 domain-containing protein [Roseovarius nanhaiticus]SEK99299.1 hypothetical protein SAMN05216208_2449 [Roseovarius nanhaiticus]SIS23324.1 hypothetical protein SAMN05421666_2866 [Roseovarius nanhaiticus]
MRIVTTTILALAVSAGASSAQAGLADERDINAGLLAVAAADKIRRECGDLSGKFWAARSYVNQLKGMASERGYTEAEIDAYVNDDAEQAKMRERRNAYFKSKGASNLDAASLCRLGQDEIKNRSRIGSFLKAK